MNDVESAAKDIYETFIPVLNECFVDLNKMASTSEKEFSQYNVKEFLCKLKYLENELLLITSSFESALKKNEAFNKELEKEKQRSRKKSQKIKELETQLNNTEFKLKVRLSNEKSKKAAIVSKDVAIQTNILVEKSKDFSMTMKNLRETAQNTLNIIRNIADGSDSDDVNEENLSENNNLTDDFQQTIDTLRKENIVLQSSIFDKNKLDKKENHLVLYDKFKYAVPQRSSSGTDYSTTLSDSSFSCALSNDSDDNYTNSRWTDPNFPRNLLKSMQRTVKKLKRQNLKLNVDSTDGLQLHKQFGQIRTEFNERNRRIQQKINYYFER